MFWIYTLYSHTYENRLCALTNLELQVALKFKDRVRRKAKKKKKIKNTVTHLQSKNIYKKKETGIVLKIK